LGGVVKVLLGLCGGRGYEKKREGKDGRYKCGGNRKKESSTLTPNSKLWVGRECDKEGIEGGEPSRKGGGPNL